MIFFLMTPTISREDDDSAEMPSSLLSSMPFSAAALVRFFSIANNGNLRFTTFPSRRCSPISIRAFPPYRRCKGRALINLSSTALIRNCSEIVHINAFVYSPTSSIVILPSSFPGNSPSTSPKMALILSFSLAFGGEMKSRRATNEIVHRYLEIRRYIARFHFLRPYP